MKRKINPRFRWIWRTWIAAFLAIEGYAIYTTEKGDTLSEQVWNFQQNSGSFGYFSVGALLAWLGWHFLGPADRRQEPREEE